jgi:NADPH:quinone reductase-like Zn-dependent oxidoreductase
MKVIRIHSYGNSDQIKIEDVPRPSVQDDEVLVKIRDAGVNPVDWKIREGYLKEYIPAKFPLTLGQDFSGEVVETGKNVREFKKGDEVFGFARGAYAEYALTKPGKIARKPKSIDFVAAASIPTAGLTAWQIIEDVAQVMKDQRALVHGGAGGVGSFAVQLARLKTAHVIATASSKDKEYLKSLGVERTIDYKTENFEKLLKDVDVVVDLVGGETLERSYDVLTPGGILITTIGSIDEDLAKRKGIRSVEFFMKQEATGLAQLAALIEHGSVKPRISEVLPLDSAKQAQDLNQSGKSHGKLVLKVA